MPLSFMASMGVCVRVESAFLFPCMFDISDDIWGEARAWLEATHKNRPYVRFCGRVLCIQDDNSVDIPPGFFPALQVEALKQHGESLGRMRQGIITVGGRDSRNASVRHVLVIYEPGSREVSLIAATEEKNSDAFVFFEDLFEKACDLLCRYPGLQVNCAALCFECLQHGTPTPDSKCRFSMRKLCEDESEFTNKDISRLRNWVLCDNRKLSCTTHDEVTRASFPDQQLALHGYYLTEEDLAAGMQARHRNLYRCLAMAVEDAQCVRYHIAHVLYAEHKEAVTQHAQARLQAIQEATAALNVAELAKSAVDAQKKMCRPAHHCGCFDGDDTKEGTERQPVQQDWHLPDKFPDDQDTPERALRHRIEACDGKEGNCICHIDEGKRGKSMPALSAGWKSETADACDEKWKRFMTLYTSLGGGLKRINPKHNRQNAEQAQDALDAAHALWAPDEELLESDVAAKVNRAEIEQFAKAFVSEADPGRSHSVTPDNADTSKLMEDPLEFGKLFCSGLGDDAQTKCIVRDTNNDDRKLLSLGEYVPIMQRCSWFENAFPEGPDRRKLINASGVRNSQYAHAGEHTVSPGDFKQALDHLNVLVDRVSSFANAENRERMREVKNRLNLPHEERMRQYLRLIKTDLDARGQ